MGQKRTPQPSLFSWVVQQHLDPEHPLLVLSGKIDWKGIDSAVAPYYARSGTGRPPQADPADGRPHDPETPVRPVG